MLCYVNNIIIKTHVSYLTSQPAKLTKALYVFSFILAYITHKLALTNTLLPYMPLLSSSLKKTHHVRKGIHGGSAVNDHRVQ